jgi:uncharacterized protein YndB with AHSA1/START domain
MVVNHNSNRLVVKEAVMSEGGSTVRREVEIEASPEEVWEAVATPDGRERWLEEPERQIHIERAEPPSRLVWWWASEEEPATRVDIRILAIPDGTRVIVTESAPRLPLAAMAACLQLVAA